MKLSKKFIIPSVICIAAISSLGIYMGTTAKRENLKPTAIVKSNEQPNIVYIMSDDHAASSISAYGSKINKTPNIDRIANAGMRFNNVFATNSICTPSRASILTGKYSHINGVKDLDDKIDGTQMTFPKELQKAGYQTAIVGKWHLGEGGTSDPTGFDYWNVLPGQGVYTDPKLIEMGTKKTYKGYVTDIITDISLNWLNNRDKNKPFMLLLHNKSPHRPWVPDAKHQAMYSDVTIPEPETFYDDYSNRGDAALLAKMRIESDLNKTDTKVSPPAGLSGEELKKWNYQQFIKDYLRCVASVDDNVGRVLDYLDKEGLSENTIVIYTSDQGFFLGDHGWFDKRFMYEQSLRMPFMIKYPKEIKPGSTNNDFVLNIDFAPTFMDYANTAVPEGVQGRSFRSLTKGDKPADWRTSMYYRYWMQDREHEVAPHYGIRTEDYKLIYYYKTGSLRPGAKFTPQWELFDLKKDPNEMNNVYNKPEYSAQTEKLKEELFRLKAAVNDKE